MKPVLILFVALTLAVACNCDKSPRYKTTGSIERIDPALDAILDSTARVEIIFEGFEWT